MRLEYWPRTRWGSWQKYADLSKMPCGRSRGDALLPSVWRLPCDHASPRSGARRSSGAVCCACPTRLCDCSATDGVNHGPAENCAHSGTGSTPWGCRSVCPPQPRRPDGGSRRRSVKEIFSAAGYPVGSGALPFLQGAVGSGRGLLRAVRRTGNGSGATRNDKTQTSARRATRASCTAAQQARASCANRASARRQRAYSSLHSYATPTGHACRAGAHACPIPTGHACLVWGANASHARAHASTRCPHLATRAACRRTPVGLDGPPQRAVQKRLISRVRH